MRTTLLLALFALAACGDKPASKSPNNGTNQASNNTVPNITTVPNNTASCPGGHCAGACFDDGWCVADAHLAFYIAMWVESADEIWLADQSGMVRVGSGTSWTQHPVEGVNQINDIIGDGSGTVWVSTHPAGIYRFDGGTWVSEELVEPTEYGTGRLARDTVTNTLYVESGEQIYERSGERWVPFAVADVDYGGLTDIAHCGGQRYFNFGAPTVIEDGRVTTLGLRDGMRPSGALRLPDGAPLVGGTQFVTYENGRYETISNGLLNSSRSIAATSLSDIWSLSGDDVWHFDGQRWTLVTSFPPRGGSSPAKSLYTDTPGQVLLIDRNGRTHVLDASGVEQDLILPPSSATTLGDHLSYQVSSDELWVATPSMSRWTSATGWQSVGSVPPDTTMFVVASETAIWAVDEAGDVSLWDGDRVREQTTGLDVPVTYVAVSDTGVAWAAGPAGVAQYDGANWTVHPDFDAGSLRGRTGDVAVVASGDEAWIFRGEEAFRWDGARWETTLAQRRTSRLGCDGDELIGLAHQPPALLRGRPDQLELASDLAGDENYSTFGAWMTGPDDVWFTAQAEPPMQHLEGEQWATSLLDFSLGVRDIQEISAGHVFALTNTALLVRAP